ncbi:receptor expression-enhancing protein 1-like isoform X2 [Glandiceps talaboti]
MVSYIISRLVILVFGTLYPAYASYKAVKTRNVKEYVKWMMYWIVFALFTCIETVADIFASLIPFYYEAKICFILWLLSPWTKGSSYLYRKFIHPTLSKKEREIDDYIATASDKGYETLKRVSKNGLTIAANAVMTSAIMGQSTILDQIRQYGTMSPEKGGLRSITEKEETEHQTEKVKTQLSATETDNILDNRLVDEQDEVDLQPSPPPPPPPRQLEEPQPQPTRRRRRRDLNKEVGTEDSNRHTEDELTKMTSKSTTTHHSTRSTRHSTRSSNY